VVGILDDIPTDAQMIDNEVLVPFAGERLMTVNSPIFIDGASKVPPRHPPAIGEHSDQILRQAGYDDTSIAQLRASGTVG
jgi:formyl-CoA transferase